MAQLQQTTVNGTLTVDSTIRTNLALFQNAANITSNQTISSGVNTMSAGPITINNGVTVTVQGDWSIV
jgi:hypothetical protein